MRKEVLMVCLLMSVVIVSGCSTTPDTGSQGGDDTSGMSGGDIEASAYDQLEQELEGAIEDIDLNDLENELLI